MAVEGDNQRIDYDKQVAMWQAWHIAAFNRSRRMPPLMSVLKTVESKIGEQQDGKTQLAIAEALNELFGGADNRKKKEVRWLAQS